ncbi:MAG: DedA family protein [Propionibacteriales bacterium]|nr:DedA family protein [Propionibacteriales bacterium]
MVTDILEWLESLPPAGVIAAAGLLVFGETTLGLGFITPGESALFIAGTTATTIPRFLIMWAVTSACAVLGYSVGYGIGKYVGPRLRNTRIVERHGAEGWDKAMDFLRRRGSFAVVIGIFFPVMRTLVPAAAGASGLPFRRFLPAAALAGPVWCALHIGLGAAAGEAARRLENYVSTGSWILLGLVVVVGAAVLIRRRRAGRTESAAPAGQQTAVHEDRPESERGSLS